MWEKGEIEQAARTFEFATRLDVHEVDALNLLVAMQLQNNYLPEARHLQERAIRRQPDEPRQYLLLADILQRMHLTAEADRARARF